MAAGTGGAQNFNDIALALSRESTRLVNNNKTGVFLDFAFAAQLAIEDYFETLGRINSDLSDDNVTNILGVEVDVSTLGGNLALNVGLDIIQARKDSMEGLAKAGLKNENKLWTLR